MKNTATYKALVKTAAKAAKKPVDIVQITVGVTFIQ